MPLIQQKLPKKLEVVQENAVSGDLPEINLRNNQTEISMSLSQEKIKNNDTKIVPTANIMGPAE